MKPIEYLWKDRKRVLGMPLSFTRYRLSEDRLFCETGLLNTKSDEVLLYRVRDLRLTISLAQRILGVGTVCVISSDKSVPHLDLKNVKSPREVKELIHQNVEAAKDKRRMRTTELLSGENGPDPHDEDGTWTRTKTKTDCYIEQRYLLYEALCFFMFKLTRTDLR